MKHLHFDCVSGAAGDMLLAALVDLGADADYLNAELCKLGVEDCGFSIEEVMRSGLRAAYIKPFCAHHAHHDHHGHDKHHHHHTPYRHLADMLAVVEACPFSSRVKERAAECFRLLAGAEGKVHGKPPEEIHFHEVGGVDTILDVFGVLLALENLGVGCVTGGAVSVGTGTVTCAHGVLPVPAPATLEIIAARKIPVNQAEVRSELLTPTGAALLGVVVDEFRACPQLAGLKIGYGAGTRELPDRPNVVRVMLGETVAGNWRDQVVELRCVIDDATAEEIAYCCERCYLAGAVEAYAVAATMKKGRLGTELTALAPEEKAEAVEQALFRHGGTFGIRRQLVERSILQRELREVEVLGETIKVKIGSGAGGMVVAQPEYEDCRQVAEKKHARLSDVFALAQAQALQK
jgi:uncharacterized protein (TIGR00299 family) protein